MKALVVYHSKTSNTKCIAEVIAKKLNTKAIPLNLLEKKGRGTKEDQEKEKKMFEDALRRSRGFDLVVVGTPTGFQKAHSKVIRFIKRVECSQVATFCTFYNKIGTTLSDLDDILKERKIKLIASCAFDNLKTGQFLELTNDERMYYQDKIDEFVSNCIS
ncbi:MAG: flavodoxin family protein [Candidatus Heimdallarchaeaceae archaeon]